MRFLALLPHRPPGETPKLVLDGELTIALRGRDPVTLPRGSVYVVPRGVEHKPSSAGGASILLVEPTGTVSTGDRSDPVPDSIDSTPGHVLPPG